MRLPYDQLTILRVAKEYYLDNLSQQEIAEKENIHRTQISRILKTARELGYVQFSISLPKSSNITSMAKQLEIRLGLRQVLIAPTPAPTSSQSSFDALCFYAAQYLEKTLPFCKNIGIGTGETLYHTAQYLSDVPCENPPLFLSSSGTSGMRAPYLQASLVLDSFSSHFGGRSVFNNFPIYCRRDQMNELEAARYEKLQQQYKKLDTVILSVGGPIDIKSPYFEEFSIAYAHREQDVSQAHGDILGNLLFDDHKNNGPNQEYITPSITLPILEKIPNVICIAQGTKKINAIISAAKQNYIKVLITDEETAKKLLQHLQS